jgi:uncharacterized protein involved in response to NO
MTTSAEQMRAWRGPALLTYGFRPFFLGAALWAALAMAFWIPMLSGMSILPTRFDPVSWHAHEFLYGYLGAVIAGFLLTAVPNWTGRLPIVGWPLGGLFALWIMGRIAVALSASMPLLLVIFADLALPAALAAVIAREIITGKNWRNLPVLLLLIVFAMGNLVFHVETAQGVFAAQGIGLRIGLSAVLTLIALIGGRIVPSFTRNWLVRRNAGRMPASPMQRFDVVALAVLIVALLLWVVFPDHVMSGAGLALAGAMHAIRLARWAGERTAAEPLVLVLHVGYAFLPLGAFAVAADIFWPGLWGLAAGQHLWMAGTIGLMTLAVMTRATLGHTGQALTAGRGTTVLYLACVTAVILRAAAGVLPTWAELFHIAAAFAWILAFGGFAVLFGPLVLRRRAQS